MSLPAGVCTMASRLPHSMRLAGVDSATGNCSPSFATSVPSPCRQAIAELRSWARTLSIAETSFRSLPAKFGAEHEFRGTRPVAELLRHHGRAGDVDLAARGFIDGAVGLHQRRQKFLGLAGAREAAADADFLPRWRRHDVEPGSAREPDHRIGLGIVDPARAAIERHVEGRGIRDAAAADLARRLQHDHLAVRRHDAPRRGDARGTGADHDNIGLARQRTGERCGPLRQGRRRRKGRGAPTGKRGASLSCHGFRGLESAENMLRTLPYSHGDSNHHGESIMIDRRVR